jgi:hypothetical protein
MQRLEVRGAVRPLYGSLGVKGLMLCSIALNFVEQNHWDKLVVQHLVKKSRVVWKPFSYHHVYKTSPVSNPV